MKKYLFVLPLIASCSGLGKYNIGSKEQNVKDRHNEKGELGLDVAAEISGPEEVNVSSDDKDDKLYSYDLFFNPPINANDYWFRSNNTLEDFEDPEAKNGPIYTNNMRSSREDRSKEQNVKDRHNEKGELGLDVAAEISSPEEVNVSSDDKDDKLYSYDLFFNPPINANDDWLRSNNTLEDFEDPEAKNGSIHTNNVQSSREDSEDMNAIDPFFSSREYLESIHGGPIHSELP